MKLTALTKDLRDAVARLSIIPGASAGLAIAQAVRFKADLAGLQIIRFSADAKIVVTLESVEVEQEDPEFLVNHSALTTHLAELPGKSILLSTKDTNLLISSGPAKSRLPVFAEECNIDPPEAELETEHIRISGEELSSALKFALLVVATDEVHGGLCGVCVRMMGDKLAVIGCDGKKAHATFLDYDLPVDVVLPSDGVNAALKVMGADGGACTLAVGESSFSIITPDAELVVALLSQNYPNMTNILVSPPTSIKSKVRVRRLELIEAMKKAGRFGDGELAWVFVEVATDGLTITGRHGPENSDYTLPVACTATEALPEALGMPSKQLVAAFSSMESRAGDEIELLLYPGTLFVRESNRVAAINLYSDPRAKK